MTDKILTLTECAERMHVERQSVWAAIQKGRLKAEKKANMWFILESDLIAYQKSKHTRQESRINGELIFDPAKQELSIPEAAIRLGVNVQHIYHLIRIGQMQVVRKGWLYVVTEDEIQRIYSLKMAKEDNQMRFA